jgi:hypothetical protein
MKSVSKLVFLALLIPVMGLAIVANPCGPGGTGCDYHYALTLTGLSGGNEDLTNTWTFAFDWVGPYRSNSPANSLGSCCAENGSPKAGWTPGGGNGFGNGTTFGSGIIASFSANSSSDVFLEIYFQDNSGDGNQGSAVDYHLTGTDAFWATLGLQTFSQTDAFSTLNGTDPPCTACTVVTTRSPLAATPEPASLLLFGTIAAGIGFGLRKRARRSTTI